MIQVKIGKQSKMIDPDLTIGQYQRITNNLEKMKNPQERLAILLDEDINEIKKLSKTKVEFILNYIEAELLQPDMDELTMTFEHDGVQYGLENDWSKLAWGAWSDFEILSSDNINDNIHHIMAILYRPVVKWKKDKYIIAEYDPEEIMSRVELFREVKVKYWLTAASFFFLLASSSMSSLESSLILKNRVNRWMVNGWKKLPRWLRERLPLDSILISPWSSQGKMLQKYNR